MTKTTLKNRVVPKDDFSLDDNILAIYMKDISTIPLLSREEEDETARAAAAGDQRAQEKLINANLRFVVNVAKGFQGQGISLLDLIAEGNLGLMNAVQRFDVGRGFHFISYAVWWIRQAILKAISEKSRMIRLPQNRVNELVRIEKARRVLGYESPGTEESREIAGMLHMDENHVEELVEMSQEPISLESPVSVGKDSDTMEDFVQDRTYRSPEDEALHIMMKDDIETVLDTLDRKEAEVIRHRYGLVDGSPKSLKEVGERFHLTKERIRQIEKKALKRLRQPNRRRILESYVA